MRLRVRETLLWLVLRLLKSVDRRDTSGQSFMPAKAKTFLLVSSTALGDTVLSTAAMATLRRRYPMARIVVLVAKSFVQILESHPDIDLVIPYYGGYRHFLRTVWALRKEQPDVALILHGNEPQATPLAYLSGARHIFKLPNANRYRFLLSNQEVETWADFPHGMQQRLAMAALVGADVAQGRMSLPLSAGACAEVDAWLLGQGLATDAPMIGFQLGASSRSRMWPAEHFIRLAHLLMAVRSDLKFVLTGSPAEADLCHDVARRIGAAALVTADVFPIETLPALVQRLMVLVSGDTGTMHVAVAVGTPTVCLFSVSQPTVSGPAYDLDRHRVIHHPYYGTVGTKTQDQRGMEQIPVAEVFAAVMELLERIEAV